MPGVFSELDLFAPPVDQNDPQSIANWEAWKKRNLSMTRPMVEQTRSPVSFNTGDPAGMVDPEALRVMAQGGPYDIEAKRNAIAAQLQSNAAAAAAAPPAGRGAFEIGSGMSAGVIPGAGQVVSNYLAPGGAWMNPNVPQPNPGSGENFF